VPKTPLNSQQVKQFLHPGSLAKAFSLGSSPFVFFHKEKKKEKSQKAKKKKKKTGQRTNTQKTKPSISPLPTSLFPKGIPPLHFPSAPSKISFCFPPQKKQVREFKAENIRGTCPSKQQKVFPKDAVPMHAFPWICSSKPAQGLRSRRWKPV
jgi:hypothetical protein